MRATTGKFGVLSLVTVVLVACVEEPLPRSFVEFMDDSLAREGVLARCNADRAATAYDVECVNARRAAAAIAAQADAESGQRERLEAQSEARRLAARQRADAQFEAQRQAVLAAEAEAQMAYEAQFEKTETPQNSISEAALPDPMPDVPPVESIETSPGAELLEPVTLPASVRPPLTTINLPRGAKPIEYQAPDPLQEIELPSRLK